jgi:hypothetical protein
MKSMSDAKNAKIHISNLNVSRDCWRKSNILKGTFCTPAFCQKCFGDDCQDFPQTSDLGSFRKKTNNKLYHFSQQARSSEQSDGRVFN